MGLKNKIGKVIGILLEEDDENHEKEDNENYEKGVEFVITTQMRYT